MTAEADYWERLRVEYERELQARFTEAERRLQVGDVPLESPE